MKVISAILFVSLTITAQAKEIVSVIYPWGMGDPMAAYSRTLIDVANQRQDRYLFVLENRPGAGGAIAARHVQTNANTILAGSTAFFVRPNFYPDTSHDIARFQPLMTQCAVPMIVSSSRYKSWHQIPTNAPILIGVSGLGSTTHLISLQIKQKFPKADPVPYRSTQDSTVDLAGARIDLNVGFPAEVSGWIEKGRAHGLGVTGRVPVMNIPTMHSMGFPSMDMMSNGHSLIVSKDVSDQRRQEWRQIFISASRDKTVQDSYARDYCQPLNLDEEQTNKWWTQQILFWREQSKTVSLPD